jgi:L-fuconolactonase
MRIDAHQHFLRRARGDYGWLEGDDPVLDPLRRDFLPADLQPLREAHGVGACVVVQAAPTVAETHFLLELASQHSELVVVVGWVDLSCADAAETLAALATHTKFRAVRPMLQDLPEADWITERPHPLALAALRQHGLRLDALVRLPQLPALIRFARAQPELPIVLDHAGKPPLAAGEAAMQAWAQGVRELATLPQVCCKWSGLLTELPAGADSAALLPVWDLLLEAFGPSRLMWGSDWPVLELAGRYGDWVGYCERLFAHQSSAEQAALWHQTARRFYGIEIA